MTPEVESALVWADNIQDSVGVPVSDKANAKTLANALRPALVALRDIAAKRGRAFCCSCVDESVQIARRALESK